jgi:hypothetical protein
MSFPEGCRLDFKAPGCEIKRNVSSRVYVWDLMRRTGAQTTKMKNKNKNHISLIKVIKSPTKPKMSFDLNMIQRFFILLYP